ncbi:MAG: hypothetical protein ACJ8AW_41875, partial [Rhodopila sp.]
MQGEPATPDAASGCAVERMAFAQARRVGRIIISVAVCVAVSMWGFIIWSTELESEVARRNGLTQGYNLAAGMAAELSDAFDDIAVELDRLDSALSTGALTADRVRAALATPGLVRSDTAIRVIGPDGRLVFSTLPSDPESGDDSRQPHFIFHRDNPAAGLLVDPPGAANPGDDPRIEVSQRLTAADGRFAGEVQVLPKAASLLRLVRQIDLGRRGNILVVGIDGIVRAGYDRAHPDGSNGVGVDLRGAPYPDTLGPGGTADYTRIGRVMGGERLMTLRRLHDYPLAVLVAQDLDVVMASP